MNDKASLPGAFSSAGMQELKRRLLFLFLAIAIYRLGAHIPVPGLDPAKLAKFFDEQSNGLLGLFNLFSGGALRNLTVFALGIMPYISASIIIQLFSSVLPSLAELRKEGESGQRKLNRYIRFATLFLAVFQAIGVSKFLAGSGIALYTTFHFYFIASVTLATGTMFLMWLGEQVTERGIGNGISMIIFASIASGLPSALGKTLQFVREGQIQPFVLLLILAVVLLVTGCVVFVERGQRRIAIQYAQRQQGRKIYAAQSSHLPLKINMSGVIPPIFASSLLLFPASIAQWFGQSKGMEWLADIGLALQQGQPLHIFFFAVAIMFFCFFYTSLVFNPKDTADNLKRSNAYIPGIRPGEQTAKYIDTVITRLTVMGGIYVCLICLLPEMLYFTWHVPFYFGGTSLLIIVVVVMDFMGQIQSLLMSHQYESLMRKANVKGGPILQLHK